MVELASEDQMGKFDIDEAVGATKQLMLIIGTWPQLSPTFAYRTFGFFSMFAIGVFTITTLVDVFTNIADLQSVSFGICCALAAFHALVKQSMLIFNKPQFDKILNSLREPILASHEDHLGAFLQEKVRLCKFCTAMYIVNGLTTAFIIILSPLLETEIERPLPVPFPLDMKDQHWLVYYSIYGLQSISILHIACGIPCFDGIIFTFIAIAAGQLRIVRERIICATRCCPSATSSLRLRKRSDTQTNDILIECVNHHIAIERYIMLIQDTFKIGFLIQLLISVVISALLGFNILLVKLSVMNTNFLRCLFFFFVTLIQLAFFCVPGNEIILQSEKIRDACYMSEWTDCGISVRKTLFIIMERSKRPLCLTAANFVNLSLDTLVSVLRSSFSYFTVLRQVYKNSNKT